MACEAPELAVMRYSQRFTQHKLELLCCLVSYMPLARACALLKVEGFEAQFAAKSDGTTSHLSKLHSQEAVVGTHPLAGTQLSVQHLAAALFLRAA